MPFFLKSSASVTMARVPISKLIYGICRTSIFIMVCNIRRIGDYASRNIYLQFWFLHRIDLNLFLFISIKNCSQWFFCHLKANLFTYIGLYHNKIIMYLLFQNNIIGNVLHLALGTKEISLYTKELSYPIKILILFVFICNDSH